MTARTLTLSACLVGTLPDVCMLATGQTQPANLSSSQTPAVRAADRVLTGYEWLADWSDLPRDRTRFVAGLASSYDRTGQDEDFNNYQLSDGACADDSPVVELDVLGPGVLTRFWMPHYTAEQAYPVRVVIDGHVRIDTTSRAWLDGQYAYFSDPLVQTLIGGQVSYEPIVFAQSLRIETVNRHWTGSIASCHYYQWNYLMLPAGSGVRPYTGELTARQRQAREAVVAMIRRVGQNPSPASHGAETRGVGARTIRQGASLTLCDLPGSGTIRAVRVRMPATASDADLDGLRLGVSGKAMGRAIDVPVSQFFGVGHGRAAYKSLPLGVDAEEGFYSYWPMPFREGVTVVLRNATGRPIDLKAARVEYDLSPPPADAGYLHAVCQETRTGPGQAFCTLLDVRGRGHYVGNLLWLAKASGGRQLLEGDDIIVVNPGGPRQSTLHGTGLEDGYNGGFYYNHSPEAAMDDPADPRDPAAGAGPYHGLLRIQLPSYVGEGPTRVDQYRWKIGDFVPFDEGIEVKVENFASQPDILLGSTAFYYSMPEVGTIRSVATQPVATPRDTRHP